MTNLDMLLGLSVLAIAVVPQPRTSFPSGISHVISPSLSFAATRKDSPLLQTAIVSGTLILPPCNPQTELSVEPAKHAS